ncbi:hypothetical protein [Acetobacterium sp.]|uniref:hypothetical protein n=1 Tax=Acetobacterium sp. TaxID=1872094 RepID=UPI003593AEF8
MPKNNPRRWMIASIIITMISVLMVFMGIVLNDFNFFWMIMVGLLLGITFGIMIFVFYKQARLLDNLFKEVDQLAHWTFGQTEQLEKAEAEFHERKSDNRILIGIMTFFFVVIGGAFLIFGFDDPDEAFFFAILMGSVLLLLFVVAFTFPIISYRRMKASLPEVYVSPYSAWVMGEYSQWAAPMTQITGVNFGHHLDGSVVIEVSFDIYQRTGPQEHICRIPVPSGKEAEGNEVALQIATVNQVDFTTSNEANDKID